MKMCDQSPRFAWRDNKPRQELISQMKQRRHMEVREDEEECTKLMKIEDELRTSKKLLEVEPISDQFESITNKDFNNSMEKEFERDILPIARNYFKDRRDKIKEKAKQHESVLRQVAADHETSTFRFSNRNKTANIFFARSSTTDRSRGNKSVFTSGSQRYDRQPKDKRYSDVNSKLTSADGFAPSIQSKTQLTSINQPGKGWLQITENAVELPTKSRYVPSISSKNSPRETSGSRILNTTPATTRANRTIF